MDFYSSHYLEITLQPPGHSSARLQWYTVVGHGHEISTLYNMVHAVCYAS